MGLSDSDSGAEDDAADFQAQVSHLLSPIIKKQKRTEKALRSLEAVVSHLKGISEDQLPNLRKEVTTQSVETNSKLERVQAELAQCASKTSVEVLRQEVASTEQRLRAALDEQRGKTAAQELVLQGLEARVEAMERAARSSEIKVGGELSAATSQLSQLVAQTERIKGEMDARLSEVSARAGSQHDGLLARLAKDDEDRRRIYDGLAMKAEQAEARASAVSRADELEARLAQMQTAAHARQEIIGAPAHRLPRDIAAHTSSDLLALPVATLARRPRRPSVPTGSTLPPHCAPPPTPPPHPPPPPSLLPTPPDRP